VPCAGVAQGGRRRLLAARLLVVLINALDATIANVARQTIATWVAVAVAGAVLIAAFLPGRPRAAPVVSVGASQEDTMDDLTDDLVFPVDSPKTTLAAVGGKGANLVQLVRAGFPVPPGFLISTAA
jgi:hypothetical protein